MKKTLLFTFVALALASVSYAQIPNSDFEQWDSSATYHYNEPHFWGTLNSNPLAQLLNVVFVSKSTDAHSGQYAMQIQSKLVSTTVAPGAAASGKIHINLSPISFWADSGFTTSVLPASITGWYKYTPIGVDSAFIHVFYTHWNGSARDTVGRGSDTILTAASTYTMFTVPIMPGVAAGPDSALVEFISSSVDSARNGSTLLIDDLAIVMGTNDLSFDENNISVYPNPSHGRIYIENKKPNNTESRIEIYNVLGSKIKSFELTPVSTEIKTGSIPAGIYLYQIVEGENHILKTGRLNIQK